MKTNVETTVNLLELCNNVKQFIFASSILAIDPQDTYSKSKMKCEDVIKDKYLLFASFLAFVLLIYYPSPSHSQYTNHHMIR